MCIMGSYKGQVKGPVGGWRRWRCSMGVLYPLMGFADQNVWVHNPAKMQRSPLRGGGPSRVSSGDYGLHIASHPSESWIRSGYVFGLVRCSGRISRFALGKETQGYLAERARILELFVPVWGFLSRQGAERAAQALRANYPGVPVTVVSIRDIKKLGLDRKFGRR